MAGIGERLKEMMPGSTSREEKKAKTGAEYEPGSHTQTQTRTQTTGVEEGGVNTAGYYTKDTTAVAVSGEAATCNKEFFTKVEDRPRMIERHEYIKEHRPVEREYVVQTRFVGERELPEGRTEEVIGVEERIIDEVPPKAPCE